MYGNGFIMTRSVVCAVARQGHTGMQPMGKERTSIVHEDRRFSLRKRLLLLLCPCVVLASCTAADAKAGFTTIDVPGSSRTFPRGINANGSVAGYYVDLGGIYHGFVRATDGTRSQLSIRAAPSAQSPSE